MIYGFGENISSNGKTGLASNYPFSEYLTQSDKPTYLTIGVAVANFLATAFNVNPSASGINVEKLFAKKFQLFYPFTEYIATKFADGVPSLKNLRPNPGAKLSYAPSALDLDVS